ncbi:hypothetical protein [Leptotrichia sp. oral taxon 212]|uniref:hypothetical protein n=1 Tax=Leptotrichia sp. oral taxon 212 TaxID=712357 RepID=UPI0006A9963B|nr:hypothetical protein [Leptotrichia sp. oral taxon 212]ALA96383.1 hypothetical protein AMK43_10535 [Leptotrichia sp. oral taxon 212]
MKKLLIGILLLMLIVSCADKPETVVSKFIDNVKEKKIEKAFKDYVVNKDAEGSMHLEYNNKIQQLLFERLFENLEYKILETKKEDANTSVVTVEIKNIDVKKVFEKMFEKVVQDTFSKGNSDNVSFEDEFKSVIESKNVPKSTYTTDFVVVKTENGNKIEITPENMDILLGKLTTTLKNLGNLDDSNVEQQTGVAENGPNAGDTQKPNEPKIETGK